MICKHCERNANIYAMSCIGCVARHCLMNFYHEPDKAPEYAEEVARKYGHDFTKLREEIRNAKIKRGDLQT